MTGYLLIESRDPFDSNDTQTVCDLATGLKRQGHDVTLFLVQNGVLPARPGAHSAALTALAGAGVEVLADDFSLKERGIAAGGLIQGVAAASLEVVVDRLADGRKAIWH
jgi:predicted peroxiredoxin